MSDRLGDVVFERVPRAPGVYLFLGADGELLYVGKATNLRTRLRSYTRARKPKLVRLVASVHTVRWECFATEERAYARETELLRGLRPRFNTTHTDPTEYLYIALAPAAAGRTRFRLTADPGPSEIAYGCFPFAANAPDGFEAVVRLVSFASTPRRTMPSRPLRAPGFEVRIAEVVRKPLDAFLAGRSPRLLQVVEDLARGEPVASRAVIREARRARAFYEGGPRLVRRLRLRHGVSAQTLTPDDLRRMLAAGLRDTAVVDGLGARDRAEREVMALRSQGRSFREIARQLNLRGVPALRGQRVWRAASVAGLLRALTPQQRR